MWLSKSVNQRKPLKVQWSQNFLTGGEASGAGGRTWSVPRDVERAGHLFCFVRQSEKVACAELFLDGPIKSTSRLVSSEWSEFCHVSYATDTFNIRFFDEKRANV
jgi:hypothetical protein